MDALWTTHRDSGVAVRATAPTVVDRATTAKEQLLREAPDWSEHDAEVALRAVQRGHSGGDTDGWGALSEIHDVAVRDTMRRLVEEDHGAGHEPW